MKPLTRRLAVGILSTALLVNLNTIGALGAGKNLSLQTSASAGEEPGGDVDDGTFQPDEQATFKTDIVNRWNDLVDGTSFEDRDRLKLDVERFAGTYGMSALSGRDIEAGEPEITSQEFVDSADPASFPVSKILSLTHYGQQNGFYCGPASAYMIMRYKGVTSSRYASDRGRALSQSSLARSTYLQTDAQRATRFALNVMAPGMNRWRENRTKGFYVQQSAKNMPTLNATMKYSAYHGMPTAIGAVESGGGRYNAHPTDIGTIGHWLVGYGYAGSGTTGYFADPASSIWSGVKPKFTYTTAGFERYFIKAHGNGVVY